MFHDSIFWTFQLVYSTESSSTQRNPLKTLDIVSILYTVLLHCVRISLFQPECRRKPKWAPPPNYNNWPSIFWRPFFSRHPLQNNNRHTSARAHKIFPIRNMRPLSIREPPSWPGGSLQGVFPPALVSTVTVLYVVVIAVVITALFSHSIHWLFQSIPLLLFLFTA